MYLEGVSKTLTETSVNGAAQAVEAVEKKAVYEHWKNWHASQISHHGKICCEIAREWITATDFSELNGDCVLTGPRWLRQKFNWGASTFPIYWCEAVRRKTLDCGALAALAHEIFTARGLKSYRVQLIQKFSSVATSQWTNSWGSCGEPLAWTKGDLIYHEGNAIDIGDRKIKVWDASAGWWVDSKPANGYGAVLAIRLSGLNLSAGESFHWGEQTIKACEWKEIC
ncbi:MAG TPA: hypothetical protein VIL74_23775 [Pyrinomonadaceae bacterium]|jgi:hypothetical protein